MRDPFLIAYLLIYFATLAMLNVVEDFNTAEPLFMLFVVGGLFTLLAHLLTQKAQPFKTLNAKHDRRVWPLTLCLLIVLVYLTIGSNTLNQFLFGITESDSVLNYFSILIQKLLIFVLIPIFLLVRFDDYSVKDYGLSIGHWSSWKTHLPVLFGMILVLLVFQYFVGSGAKPIRNGEYSSLELLLGMPPVLLWLILEVGVVEEFLFRVVLQTRLSLWFKSELRGILLASVLFGLAHAPGLFLRGAGSITAIGENPSMFLALGYSVVILSVPGFFLGLIWSRTRNFPLIVLIHAATDLLPNYPEMMHVFGGK